MSTLLSLHILVTGNSAPTHYLFGDKEFEKTFIEQSHRLFKEHIEGDIKLKADFDCFFEAGKEELPRREWFLIRVNTYITTIAGLIWLSGNGKTFILFSDKICSEYISSLLSGTECNFPSEDIQEARQLMESDLPQRVEIFEDIAANRISRGRGLINAGTILRP